MVNKNNTESKSHDTKHLKQFDDSKELLNQIYLNFGKGLKSMMLSYFESVDDIIYAKAEHSKTKQKTFFESLKSIRVHKYNVLSSYLNTISQTFVMFQKKRFNYFEDKVIKVNPNENSINESDIEEKLTQNTLIHNLETYYQDHFSAIVQRFSQLNGCTLERHQIPVGPFVLVSSFAKSIRLLHLDMEIKQALYQHYQECLHKKLNGFYHEINLFLKDNKAYTDLELNSVDKQSVPFNKSQKYTISKQTIIKQLDKIQVQLIKNASKQTGNNTAVIKKLLMTELERIQLRESRHSDYRDIDIIDWIAMKFEFIANDSALPDAVKNVILTLQIPYMKIAFIDESILENKKHPALLLFSLIHASAQGWSLEKDINQSFLHRLKLITNDIIHKPNLSHSFFTAVLTQYQSYIDTQKNEFKREQKKIIAKSIGKDKISAAMKSVNALIILKTENINMPDDIKGIIMGPWKNLLSLLLVRYSDTSEQYLRMVAFIDDLLRLIDSNQYGIIIEATIEKLASVYSEGLKLVAYSGDELTNRVVLFKLNLLKLHKLDRKSKQSKPKTYAIIPNVFNNASQKNNYKNKAIKTIKYSQKFLKQIKIGAWMDFCRENKDPVTAQLSWINPKTDKYIFVNDRGLKVTDRSAKQLINGLNDKSIVVTSK